MFWFYLAFGLPTLFLLLQISHNIKALADQVYFARIRYEQACRERKQHEPGRHGRD